MAARCEMHHSLQWRHNGRDGVSIHQLLDCLLSRLFRHRSKKTSKFRVAGLCWGINRWPVNSPHKGPVTRKVFAFDDVIMVFMKNSAEYAETEIILRKDLTRFTSQLRHKFTPTYKSARKPVHQSNPFLSDLFVLIYHCWNSFSYYHLRSEWRLQ